MVTGRVIATGTSRKTHVHNWGVAWRGLGTHAVPKEPTIHLQHYSAFQNYRRVGFLKFFKFGLNFFRVVFGILLRITPQLLSYSF